MHPERFASKLRELLDYHNFVLTHYFKRDASTFEPTLRRGAARSAESCGRWSPTSATRCTSAHAGAAHSLLFEGAQGTLLDIDHGTYPYVTSSQLRRRRRRRRHRRRPASCSHYILGITKAYTTRVGAGPVPDRADRSTCRHDRASLPSAASEFGTVTGRPRRCGWLDAAALKRSMQHQRRQRPVHHQARRARRPGRDQGLRRLRARGQRIDILPLDADDIVACVPVYESFPAGRRAPSA